MAEVRPSLQRGANLAITVDPIDVSISWRLHKASVYACLIGNDGRLARPSDIVALGNPSARDGAVQLLRAEAADVAYRLRLAPLPPDVMKILFCVVVAGGKDSGDLDLAIALSDEDDVPITRFDLPDDKDAEAAALVGELYRHSKNWKFRAVGQGFKGGIEPLAAFLHCSSDDLRGAGQSAKAAPAPRPDSSLPSTAAASSPDDLLPGSDQGFQPRSLFSCNGWILSAKGVEPAPGSPKRGASVFERELLDLRADTGGRLWPALFLHQPITGEALLPPPRFELTVGRALAAHGMPELDQVKSLDSDSRREETMPEGAQLFASGGTPPRLVGLDPSTGRTFWLAPFASKWLQVARCPPTPALPHYALALVGHVEGVFYGSDEGLVEILANQGQGFKVTELPAPPIGPAGLVGDRVAVPLRNGQGMSVALRLPGGEIRHIPVKADEGWREEVALGAPVVSDELMFWVGTFGFLGLEDAENNARAVWKRWPGSVEGLPFLRPYRAPNGRFWAMCREVSDGKPGRAVTCGLSFAGAREIHGLLGPHVSVGGQTFRINERHARPWDEMVESISLGKDYEGSWLLPIARFGDRSTLVALVKDRSREGSGNRQFLFREGSTRPAELSFALHTDNAGFRMLHYSLRIASTDEIEIFLGSERFYIHHPETNKCASWSISY